MHGKCIGPKQLFVHDLTSGTQVELRRYDRLDMAEDVYDVHCNRSHFIGEGPFRLQFWRYTSNTCFAFISHLFDVPGFVFYYMMIGDLHTLDLGVTPAIIGRLFLILLQDGRAFRNATTKVGLVSGCRVLTHRLHSWYRANKIPNKKESRIGKITLKMLRYESTSSTGFLKCKGMQARRLVGFAQSLLDPKTVAITPQAAHLKAALDALARAYAFMKTPKRHIDGRKLAVIFDTVVLESQKGGVHQLPKFHMCRHFGDLTDKAGNPRHFSEAADESKNREIVKVAAASFTPFFDEAILSREQLMVKLER